MNTDDADDADDEPGPDPADPATVARYRDRLRARYPNPTKGLSADALTALVANALALCGPLQITAARDVTRFLALSVRITPAQKASPFLAQVTRRVLAHTDWPARQRLDFIDKHVVGRPPPDPEPDFGPWFVDPSPPAP